jgi:hypothetical protein
MSDEINNLNKSETFWGCGQIKKHPAWEWQGLFSTEEKAVAACRNEDYFIFPIILDEELPDKTINIQDAYYPKEVR